jgi:hypothetical protein
MTIDCVSYVSSVANPNKHGRKIECLEAMAHGVLVSGKTCVIEREYKYTPSKLAVMLGWATTNTGGRNIALRKQIIAEQQKYGYKTMCIDASCFKYLDNHGTYLRYSIGGPFYDRAEYANANSGPEKWNEISSALNLIMEPPRLKKSGYILICMQRDGGFAMKTLDPMVWLKNKVDAIRKVTNRKIYIRPHPGQYSMKDFEMYTGINGKRLSCTVVEPTRSRLIDDLQHAHTAVFFNSSASVAAVLAGVPIFVDDNSCVAWDVANHDIASIEHPTLINDERYQWIWNLSAAHWSDQDARSGKIYQKFLPYI